MQDQDQDQSSPAYLAAVKPEQLKCPRCESSNTKFCYYNNYNLSQPRHFCKTCRRYWTRGGTLRNVPVGGACRETQKRPSNPNRIDPTRKSKARRLEPPPVESPGSNHDPTRTMVGAAAAAGSFGELLASGDRFGSLLGGLNRDGPGPIAAQLGDFAEDLDLGSGLDPVRDEDCIDGTDGYLLQTGGESSFIGWPDLDIHTHG